MISAILISAAIISGEAEESSWSVGLRLGAQHYDADRNFGSGTYRNRFLASPGIELQVPIYRKVSARTYIDYLEVSGKEGFSSESGFGAGVDLIYQWDSIYAGIGARRIDIGNSSSNSATATLGYARDLSPFLFWRIEGIAASTSDFSDYAVVAALNFRFGSSHKRFANERLRVDQSSPNDYFYLDVPDEVADVFYIHFDFDSALLTSRARQTLATVAEYLRRDESMRALLVGHTDLIGSEAYNQRLSEERANIVKGYLIEHFGMSHQRIEVEG